MFCFNEKVCNSNIFVTAKTDGFINGTVFWLLTSCSSETARRFGGTYFQIQVPKVSQETTKRNGMLPVSTDFLFDFLFDTEDEAIIFLRNGGLCPDHPALRPKIPYTSAISVLTSDPTNGVVMYLRLSQS
jgi:hypothetical protein